MSGGDVLRHDRVGWAVRESEERTAEGLAMIRGIRGEWELYERVMREHARRLESAGEGEDPKNYFVLRRGDARREREGCVERLVREQVDVLDAAEREMSSCGEDEQDRLRREGTSLWD